jgi:hypothetical protein
MTFFTMLKHLCSTLFISSHFQKHPSRHPYFRNNSVQHLFRFFSLPVAETPLAATFPVAETPTTFHLPLDCCNTILNNLSISHPPSLTKQFRPAIVSPFSIMLKHH